MFPPLAQVYWPSVGLWDPCAQPMQRPETIEVLLSSCADKRPRNSIRSGRARATSEVRPSVVADVIQLEKHELHHGVARGGKQRREKKRVGMGPFILSIHETCENKR